MNAQFRLSRGADGSIVDVRIGLPENSTLQCGLDSRRGFGRESPFSSSTSPFLTTRSCITRAGRSRQGISQVAYRERDGREWKKKRTNKKKRNAPFEYASGAHTLRGANSSDRVLTLKRPRRGQPEGLPTPRGQCGDVRRLTTETSDSTSSRYAIGSTSASLQLITGKRAAPRLPRPWAGEEHPVLLPSRHAADPARCRCCGLGSRDAVARPSTAHAG